MRYNVPARGTRILPGLLLFLLFTSCLQEIETRPVTGTEGESLVTFCVQFPGAAIPATRSLSEAEENTVETIDILLFRPEGGVYEYTAGCEGADITTASDTRIKTFTVKLKQGRYDVVILANARDIVLSASPEGLTKEAALADFEASLPVGGKWPADGTRAFPMWGEAGTILIDDNTDLTGSDKVKIHRMVARVDVNVISAAATTFRLQSVDVYNYNTHGTLVPDRSRWDTTTDPAKPRVTAPRVPASSTLTQGPIRYIGTEINSALNQCVREIYLLESENHSNASHNTPIASLSRTCLVIGGVWDANGDGDFTNDGPATYYRVDFSEGTGSSQKYLDILRNHWYSFNITKVAGRGYEDSYTAFISGPVNIESEVVAWNETDMNDIVTDGQYQLTVNRSRFDFYGEGRAQTMKVYTDYPGGWKIDPATRPSWITVTPDQGDREVSTEVRVSTTQIPSPLTEREGIFHILAGAIRKEIQVRQTNEAEMLIEVNPLELTFRRTPAGSKTITVRVYPEEAKVCFIEAGPAAIGVLSSWALFPTDNLQQVTTYEFRPDPNNTGDLLSSFVTVYIADENGNMVSRQVTIYQLASDLLFEVTKPDYYPAAGGPASFDVKSATPWRIYDVTEPSGQPTLVTAGWSSTLNEATGTPVTYPFTLTRNDSWEYRTAVFKVTSPDEDFVGQEIVIKQDRPSVSLTVSPTVINFGNTTSTATSGVTVTSNARWQYATSGDWDQTVGSASPTAGSESGSHTYHSTTPSTATFGPKVYTAASGTPAAGTPYSAQAIFTTTGHSDDIAVQSAAVTINRTVPAFFDFTKAEPGNNSTLSKTVTSVRITVETNGTYTISANQGGGSVSPGASVWGSKFHDINIPANDSWQPRTVTVSYSGNHIGSAVNGTVTYNQPSHTAGTASLNPTTLTADGGTVTASFTGDYPTGWIQVQALYGSTVLAGPTTTNANKQVALGVSKNTESNEKTIQFQYRRQVNGVWESSWTNIGSVTQAKGRTNFILTVPPYRVVALEDARTQGTTGSQTMNWPMAMGIPQKYIDTRYHPAGQNVLDYTKEYAVENGGCAAYWEGSPTDSKSGQGCWRVPTREELKDMCEHKEEVGNLRTDQFYSDYAMNAEANNGIMVSEMQFYDCWEPQTNKSVKDRVRCVRSQ